MGEPGAAPRGGKKPRGWHPGVAGEVAVQAQKPLALGEASEQAMSSRLQWEEVRLMGAGCSAALKAEPAGFLAANVHLARLRGLHVGAVSSCSWPPPGVQALLAHAVSPPSPCVFPSRFGGVLASERHRVCVRGAIKTNKK